jgi:hypothetical protein
MNIILDDKPFVLEPKDWQSFEEFCNSCAEKLMPQGRVIRAVSVDGNEVNCSTPPSTSALRGAQKIVITTCVFEELIHTALKYQHDLAQNTAKEVLQLSTDCLIDLPEQTCERWSSVLNSFKSMISFIPQFPNFTPLTNPTIPEASEESLTHQIHLVQEAVDVSRKALEAQDIVLFSDTLELRFIPWVKDHEKIAKKFLDALNQSISS